MKQAVCCIALLLALTVAAGAADAPANGEAAITREELQGRVQALEAAQDLPENTREEALKLLKDAMVQFDARARHAAARQELALLRTEAPRRLADLEARLANPAGEAEFTAPEGITADAAQQQLEQAQADHKAAEQALEQLRNDSAERQNRRKVLPDLIRAAKDKLQSAREQRSALPLAQDAPQVAQARAVFLQIRQEALDAEVRAMEEELAGFEILDKLLQMSLNVKVAEERQASQRTKTLQGLVEKLRRSQAELAEQQAQRELVETQESHPLLLGLAQENLGISSRRTGPDGLLAKTEATNRQLAKTSRQLERIQADRKSVQARIEVAGMSNFIGMLLRKHAAELPDIRTLRKNIRERQETIVTEELNRLELDERSRWVSIDDELEAQFAGGKAPDGPIRERARQLLSQRYDALRALAEDTRTYSSALKELDAKERQLAGEVEEFASFIDENVLWIRSAAPLGWQTVSGVPGAIGWLLSRSQLAGLTRAAWADVRSAPLLYVFAALLLAGLITTRRSARQELAALAERVADIRTDSFKHTIRAAADTAACALPGPAALWFAAWRLGGIEPADDFTRHAAAALLRVLWIYAPLEIMRHVCRPHGLGEAHFRWPRPMMDKARRLMLAMMLIVAPLIFVTVLLDHQTSKPFSDSLGRLTFMAAMAALSVTSYLLVARSGEARQLGSPRRPSLLARTKWLWGPLLPGAPLLLALAAGLSYTYTAMHLFWRLVFTMVLVLALLILHGLLLRWIFVLRRRLAVRQVAQRQESERKQLEAKTEGAAGAEPAAIAAAGQTPTLTLSEVRQRSRRLLNSIIGVGGLIGLYLIWVNVLPALGVLRGFSLWGSGGVAGAGVTLADLLLAVAVVIITAIAARNLPGLVEAMLLQRLPLDSGTRYAATTVFSYVIAVAGLLTVASMIGISWTSVQWLIAALTVGLGFGLQEIVANFVSGLIILFERPVRVGDTVTIGEVSGTVSRIRIRATTITDWDRKELVVPNKEFITGRLVNWTLSDDVLRICVPVGIAYGSDTKLASELLLRAAQENENVLDDPPPQALFLAFGDSALSFELRVFIRGIGMLLKVKNDLHMQVDRAFRRAGIKIAFPQLDLHMYPQESSVLPKPGIPADREATDRAAPPGA